MSSKQQELQRINEIWFLHEILSLHISRRRRWILPSPHTACLMHSLYLHSVPSACIQLSTLMRTVVSYMYARKIGTRSRLTFFFFFSRSELGVNWIQNCGQEHYVIHSGSTRCRCYLLVCSFHSILRASFPPFIVTCDSNSCLVSKEWEKKTFR